MCCVPDTQAMEEVPPPGTPIVSRSKPAVAAAGAAAVTATAVNDSDDDAAAVAAVLQAVLDDHAVDTGAAAEAEVAELVADPLTWEQIFRARMAEVAERDLRQYEDGSSPWPMRNGVPYIPMGSAPAADVVADDSDDSDDDSDLYWGKC
jgi:hypothetical protein